MSKVYKRRLSSRHAKACEEAKSPRCVCRCGGALHGRSHESYRFYEGLLLGYRKKAGEERAISEEEVKHLVSTALEFVPEAFIALLPQSAQLELPSLHPISAHIGERSSVAA